MQHQPCMQHSCPIGEQQPWRVRRTSPGEQPNAGSYSAYTRSLGDVFKTELISTHQFSTLSPSVSCFVDPVVHWPVQVACPEKNNTNKQKPQQKQSFRYRLGVQRRTDEKNDLALSDQSFVLPYCLFQIQFLFLSSYLGLNCILMLLGLCSFLNLHVRGLSKSGTPLPSSTGRNQVRAEAPRPNSSRSIAYPLAGQGDQAACWQHR